jgi:hypothetical protein
MKRLSYLTAILCSALFALSGCGGGSSSSSSGGNPSPQNADVSGPWQATATSTSTPGVTPVIVEANLADSGGSLSSTAFVVVNSCVTSDANSKVSGSVHINAVSLTATYPGVTVALTGTVSGSTITGTYTASGACGNDSGTWIATKMPQINGNYSGNVFSNSNTTQAIPVTGSIVADASLNITGHASISSVCFNQFTLSGTQIGGAGQFVGTDSQGDSISFLFISKDAAFGSIAGVYSVTAGPSSCTGDSGTGSLTKM